MRRIAFGIAIAAAIGITANARAGGPTATGCSDCNAGCGNTCGKLSLFDRWKCGWGCGWGCNTGGLCAWLKRPCPSSAPFLRQQDLPLGFPNHPYVRSPRDYFMDP